MAESTLEEFLGTGRRKTAVARVRMAVGTGKITVNKKPIEVYFPTEQLRDRVTGPLAVTNAADKYDLKINVNGGGPNGQADAARLGVARALLKTDQTLRPALKSNGMLTRDPRERERKKPGQPGARRRFQFSKR